jgi:hypothetical protein
VRDDADTVTIGQWTVKSGEKVAIYVTLLPPEPPTGTTAPPEDKARASGAKKMPGNVPGAEEKARSPVAELKALRPANAMPSSRD